LGAATAITLEHYPDFDLQAMLLNMVAQGALSDFSCMFGQDNPCQQW